MSFCKVIFISVLLIIFSLQTSLACTCFTPPPPCYKYWKYDAVFIGTVKEIRQGDDSPFAKIKVEVNKNYKGVNSDFVFTQEFGTSCDFEGFALDRKLLIYGNLSKEDKSFFSTGLCARSAAYDEDLIDFDFLNSLKNPTPNYWIWGTISRGDRGSGIEGVKAEVFDDKKKLTSVSDKDGNLKIVVSKEGKYKVRVFMPKGMAFTLSNWEEQWKIKKGGRLDIKKSFAEYEVEVKNNQCGWFDTVLFNFKIN
jgi:hypothetical protein